MTTLLDLFKKFMAFWDDFVKSRSGRSMARVLYAVLVFGTLYAVFHGKLTGTAAATVLVALVTGLSAAWVAGKVAGGPPTVAP
ncbi:MAG: hypothetical protein JSR79_00320 [Proteobacteria bacterium]|nr:hypothetical protein [Pseudomonadota bacterium]